MNSINIGAASAASNLGLFKHNRSLSTSRHSIARSLYASSANMAAAIVASNQGKTQPDTNDDHLHRIVKVNDPVVLRTCTVDEAFRRMEELVGSEEEEKNWKGIVIALVVIGLILGIIVTAIVVITPAPDKYDPGEPFTFSNLMDESMQVKRPSFSWVRGSDQYTVYVERKTNTTDKFVQRHVQLVNLIGNADSILVPQQIISSRMRDLVTVSASPNTDYALVELDRETNSINKTSTYLIYDKANSSVLDITKKSIKLQHACWIGSKSELVYIHDKDIYYKKSPQAKPSRVTTDGSPTVFNGIADKIYKGYIFPNMDSLIWPSPTTSMFVYAKINVKNVTSDKREESPSTKTKLGQANSISLHVFDTSSSRGLNLAVDQGYVTSVSWMHSDRVLIVWLASDHQTEQYIICSCGTGTCRLNYEYRAAEVGLSWVGLYGAPVYNPLRREYYTLLPDPANENKLYRHVAAIKEDANMRHDPTVTFLTSHGWSDTKILGVKGNQIYFYSTGSNFTHQHVYRVNAETKDTECLTGDRFAAGINYNVTYTEAEFSVSYNYTYISVLGPGIPRFYVVDVKSLFSGELVSTEVDEHYHKALSDIFETVYLPLVEYLTVPLDDNVDASVKLIQPEIFDRTKVCLYELVLVINTSPGKRMATQEFTLGFEEYLAKNKTYIIAIADMRGSGDRGEKVHQALHGSLGSAEANDIATIISFLVEHKESYKVDEDYVAVIGKDYGGFVSLHAIANQGIRCAVVSSPITSISMHGGWLAERYMGNRTAEEVKLNYDCTDTSTTCSIPHTDTLLIAHGTDDAVISIENSYSLMRQLQLASYYFRQQIYPNAGHQFKSTGVESHYYQTVANYLYECFEIKYKFDDSKIEYCEHRLRIGV